MVSKAKSGTKPNAFTTLEKGETIRGWREGVRIGGEILFLIWILGISCYFYQKQGFFALVQHLIQEGL